MIWKSRLVASLNRLLSRYDIRIVRGSHIWRPMSQLGSQPAAGVVSAVAPPNPFFRVYAGSAVGSPQQPFDFAVVMPTILRPSIAEAIRSIFAQNLPGRVQTLLGVDYPSGGGDHALDELCREIPANHVLYLFYPGYSTSRRHGGLHPEWGGGVLRTVLTYLANSRYVAYLDDDNWWTSDHLSSLREALQGYEWAYAGRWFVHPRSRRPISEDLWESVGPGHGAFAKDFGGFVDTNCIAFDKLACEAAIRWWSIPLRNTEKAMDADRNVFRVLSTEFKGRPTGKPTVYYTLDEKDSQHPFRMRMIGAERYAAAAAPSE
jgi:hypothetical protein